jgi:hypothetical protein
MTSDPLNESDTLSLDAEVEVDEICLRFESAWKAGPRPAIEDFLTGAWGIERLALLRELILLDLCYRRRLQEHPRVEDYLARFPDLEWNWTEELLSASDPASGIGLDISSGSATLTTPASTRQTEGKRLVALTNYDQLELIG